MRIALYGSYFGDNFGDSLFAIQYYDHLIKNYPNAEVYVPLASKEVRQYLGVNSKGGFNEFLKADRVVFIGGGYFGERSYKVIEWHVRFVIRYISIIMFCIVSRKPFSFHGVGAGPLRFSITRYLAKTCVNFSDKFIARDKESFSFLKEIGVKPSKLETSSDSVVYLVNTLLEANTTPRSSLKGEYVLIHLPVDSEYIDRQEQIIKAISRNLPGGYNVICTTDFKKEGYNRNHFILAQKYFDTVTFVDYENPEQFLRLIVSAKYVFTVKLHVGIISTTACIPTISFYVHNKTPRYYKQIQYGVGALEFFRNWSDTDLDIELKKWLKYGAPKIDKSIIDLSKRNLDYLNELINE